MKTVIQGATIYGLADPGLDFRKVILSLHQGEEGHSEIWRRMGVGTQYLEKGRFNIFTVYYVLLCKINLIIFLVVGVLLKVEYTSKAEFKRLF